MYQGTLEGSFSANMESVRMLTTMSRDESRKAIEAASRDDVEASSYHASQSKILLDASLRLLNEVQRLLDEGKTFQE